MLFSRLVSLLQIREVAASGIFLSPTFLGARFSTNRRFIYATLFAYFSSSSYFRS